MILFFGEDNLEDAVAEDVGVVINFLVLEKVLLVHFHCPEQGIMLCAIHLILRISLLKPACESCKDNSHKPRSPSGNRLQIFQ